MLMFTLTFRCAFSRLIITIVLAWLLANSLRAWCKYRIDSEAGPRFVSAVHKRAISLSCRVHISLFTPTITFLKGSPSCNSCDHANNSPCSPNLKNRSTALVSAFLIIPLTASARSLAV
jgi:hypothetical protein